MQWRNTQEAEGVGLENREAANNRAGVQIPLSPPIKIGRPFGRSIFIKMQDLNTSGKVVLRGGFLFLSNYDML